MGNRILRTPRVDRLAGEGSVFANNFATTAICMSSRASILTGLYSHSHGINDFSASLSGPQLAATYPYLLRKSGYRVGLVGKWGVGALPPQEDFDYLDVFPGQGHYFPTAGKPRHLTAIQEESALSFLADCRSDEPFCLSISFKAPHVQDEDARQFLYDPRDAGLYAKACIPVPRTASDRHFRNLPACVRESEGRRRWEIRFNTPDRFQESVKGYYRLIHGVDQAVGAVRNELSRRGLAGNTILIFTSDNGFFLGEHGLAGKWLMFEESIRTPLIVYDPREVAGRGGRRFEEMTLNIDLAPTILELAGLTPPAAMQGRSLWPFLSGRRPAVWRRDWFYEHRFRHPRIPQTEGLRTERWKYVRYVDREPVIEELYDLGQDSGEERNLIDRREYTPRVDKLRARYDRYRASLENWRPDRPWVEP